MHLITRIRLSWLVILVSALGLEATALYFQYVMQLDPCVLCIYERLAVAGIGLAGLIGLTAPGFGLIRFPAYLLWGVSAIWGLSVAMEHVGVQFGSPDLNCEFFANFPAWLKLDEWFPAVFAPTGYCDDIQWQFLGFSMPQWMTVVYSGYLVLLVLALVSEFLRPSDDAGRV